MSRKRDYNSYSFFIAILVVALMLALRFIPPFKIGNITFKRTNIISDIVKQEDSAKLLGADEYFDTTFLAESAKEISTRQLNDTTLLPTAKNQSWDFVSPSSSTSATESTPKGNSSDNTPINVNSGSNTQIEDYSDGQTNITMLREKMRQLKNGGSLNIAILGDSFIEGDIITADIREQMQTIYKGRGIGFIPFCSPISKYRGTIKHTFGGWTTYNVLQKRQAPAYIKDKFFVSGMVCVPTDGAWVKYEGVNFRKHIKECGSAKLLFINQKNTTIHVKVNGTSERVFTPEPSEFVQQISINTEISTLELRIENPEGFVGYGVCFGDKQGVNVDNFSIRGNSGMALFGTEATINRQIDNIIGYDLIVLQYGLNAMDPNVSNYNNYSAQVVKITNFIHKCFPNSVILIMSVGDRSTQQGGEFITMPAVHLMIDAQQTAARRTGATFWNTFMAMGGENSMVKFVERKWAAKDYTHIGYPGGKYIGTEFAKSLIRAADSDGSDIKNVHNLPSYKPSSD